MRALLDVNVLIALNDQGHIHHTLANQWMAQHMHLGWASCPLTQNGMLRIMSQASYVNSQPLNILFQMLRRETQHAQHAFWPDDLSLLDETHIDADKLLSPSQLTDAYLLALAVKNQGRFITLDKRIPLNAVPGAKPLHLVSL
jgi:toxin-antitoxin system PIN domain toxin